VPCTHLNTHPRKEELCSKGGEKQGWTGWCMSLISATQEVEVGRSQSQAKARDPYLKNKLKAKRAGGVAQVITCLASGRP
jgi:hypothetical protein